MQTLQGIDHPTTRGAGRFLQQDAGGKPVKHIVKFLLR